MASAADPWLSQPAASSSAASASMPPPSAAAAAALAAVSSAAGLSLPPAAMLSMGPSPTPPQSPGSFSSSMDHAGFAALSLSQSQPQSQLAAAHSGQLSASFDSSAAHRSRLKARSRSGSPNPRLQAAPYAEHSPQDFRLRAHSATFERAAAASRQSQLLPSRQRVYSNPDGGANPAAPDSSAAAALPPHLRGQLTAHQLAQLNLMSQRGGGQDGQAAAAAGTQTLRTAANVEEELSNLFAVALQTRSPHADQSLRKRELPPSFWVRDARNLPAASGPSAAGSGNAPVETKRATTPNRGGRSSGLSISTSARSSRKPSTATSPRSPAVGMSATAGGTLTAAANAAAAAAAAGVSSPSVASMSSAATGSLGGSDLPPTLDSLFANIGGNNYGMGQMPTSMASTTNSGQRGMATDDMADLSSLLNADGVSSEQLMEAVLRDLGGPGGSTDMPGLDILGGESADLTALLNTEINLMQMSEAGDGNIFRDLGIQ